MLPPIIFPRVPFLIYRASCIVILDLSRPLHAHLLLALPCSQVTTPPRFKFCIIDIFYVHHCNASCFWLCASRSKSMMMSSYWLAGCCDQPPQPSPPPTVPPLPSVHHSSYPNMASAAETGAAQSCPHYQCPPPDFGPNYNDNSHGYGHNHDHHGDWNYMGGNNGGKSFGTSVQDGVTYGGLPNPNSHGLDARGWVSVTELAIYVPVLVLAVVLMSNAMDRIWRRQWRWIYLNAFALSTWLPSLLVSHVGLRGLWC